MRLYEYLFLLLFSVFIMIRSTNLPPYLCIPLSRFANSPPRRLAYFISGTENEAEMLKRVLQAVYHPHNVYAVYLDKGDLREFIDSHPVFSKIGNVKMITRSNLVSEDGPTKIANVLHAAAVLLKEGDQWDWFINLDASSYPLVTQDDLLYALSTMPRDLNFIDHTSHLSGRQDSERSRDVIIDQGLYILKEGVIDLPEKRVVPTSFDIYTGSPWMGLTRAFIEYCIIGYDYLPRTVLMYHANSISSAESYFHTVMLNSPQFCNTTISTDLHYKPWGGLIPGCNLPFVNMDDRCSMIRSNAPFARKFNESINGDVLDWIDENLLSRGPHTFVPGGWCGGLRDDDDDPCLKVSCLTNLMPGDGAWRLYLFFHGFTRARNVSSSSLSPRHADQELWDKIRGFSCEVSNSGRTRPG